MIIITIAATLKYYFIYSKIEGKIDINYGKICINVDDRKSVKGFISLYEFHLNRYLLGYINGSMLWL